MLVNDRLTQNGDSESGWYWLDRTGECIVIVHVVRPWNTFE